MKKLFNIFKKKIKKESDLLVIKQKDINSVPIVIYNGKGIKLKQHILFEWKTSDADFCCGSNFDIQYIERQKEGKSRIVREGYSHPIETELSEGLIYRSGLHTVAENEQSEFIMPINKK